MFSFGQVEEKKRAAEDEDRTEAPAEEKEPPLLLTEHFAQLCKQERWADVVFVVGEGSDSTRFFAHRLVLAVSSPVFEAMVYPLKIPGQRQEDVPPLLEIKVKGVKPSAFSTMLDCIYGDFITIDASNLTDLIAIGKKYQVEKLQVQCSEFMETDVNVDNALELFRIGPELLGDQEFGMEFIRENAADILVQTGFESLPLARVRKLVSDDKLGAEESVIFNAVLRWGTAECKRQGRPADPTNVREVVKELLPHIRFPLMELQEIASVVAASQLLSQEDMLNLFTFMSVPEEVRAQLGDSKFNAKPREGGFVAAFRGSPIVTKNRQKAILSLIANDPKKMARNVQLQLLYRGSRDGLTADVFHSKCNGKGSTITVINSTNGCVFGGYHGGDWGESNYSSAESWLFSLKGTSTVEQVAKFIPTGSGNSAYCNAGYGPTWGGGHDLHVNTNMASNQNYCQPNSYQASPVPGFTTTYTTTTLAGGYNFTVKDIEVYQVKRK